MRVDENLERMRGVLHSGDAALVKAAFGAGAGIDAMSASLTERCFLLLGREGPAASDRRFIVAVLRIISELEAVGDLALRVVTLTPEQPALAQSEIVWDILLSGADEAVDRFRMSLRAWAAQDVGLATELATRGRGLDLYFGRLISELQRLEGGDTTRAAVGALVAGIALERVADHSTTIGCRLRDLLTGGPAHLARGEARDPMTDTVVIIPEAG